MSRAEQASERRLLGTAAAAAATAPAPPHSLASSPLGLRAEMRRISCWATAWARWRPCGAREAGGEGGVRAEALQGGLGASLRPPAARHSPALMLLHRGGLQAGVLGARRHVGRARPRGAVSWAPAALCGSREGQQ